MSIDRKTIIRQTAPAPAAQLPETLHPVLRRVYALRGIGSADELEQGLERLLPWDLLSGTAEAAVLLERQLREQGRILVVGDFDADGATSCALAVRALRAMGAADVRFLVPNRFEFGYGLTPAIVAEALKLRPDLLVTVDNGISSVDGVDAANRANVPVLVTDHHLPGPQLPAAAAMVNPNLPEDAFPSKNLAGVGVIFYVMLALRARLRESGWFRERGLPEPNMAELLDLVALGTVADVVPLDRNNRILVEQGLRRIRAGRGRAGIVALLQLANRSVSAAVAADLGFAVAPRLNAAGRLEDMSLGIECLLVDDPDRARAIAQELNELNQTRRQIEGQMQQQALESLAERLQADGDALPFGLCLFQEDWHQGVIGILAGRLRERLHRPVIAFAPGEPGMLKGSCRSVPGLHIRDTLDAVAARHPGLLERFGGHAMAAGLTLRAGDYAAFSAAFDEEVRARLKAEDLRGVIHSDGPLAEEDLTLALAEQLRLAGPWGQGFPEPLFDGGFRLLEQRVLGERHLKLRVVPEGGSRPLDAIAFNRGDALLPDTQGQVHLAYRLGVNEYQGTRTAQLVVEHIEPV